MENELNTRREIMDYVKDAVASVHSEYSVDLVNSSQVVIPKLKIQQRFDEDSQTQVAAVTGTVKIVVTTIYKINS